MAFYPHNIPSIHEIHPAVPAVLGALDLNRSIHAGDPVARANLTHARLLAKDLNAVQRKTLKLLNAYPPDTFISALGVYPEITDEVAHSAELRAVALQNAHMYIFCTFYGFLV